MRSGEPYLGPRSGPLYVLRNTGDKLATTFNQEKTEDFWVNVQWGGDSAYVADIVAKLYQQMELDPSY